jgi:hypothetical protein
MAPWHMKSMCDAYHCGWPYVPPTCCEPLLLRTNLLVFLIFQHNVFNETYFGTGLHTKTSGSQKKNMAGSLMLGCKKSLSKNLIKIYMYTSVIYVCSLSFTKNGIFCSLREEQKIYLVTSNDETSFSYLFIFRRYITVAGRGLPWY